MIRFSAMLGWIIVMMLHSFADSVLLLVRLKVMRPVGEAVWRWRIA